MPDVMYTAKRHSMAQYQIKQQLSEEKKKRNSVMLKLKPNKYRDEIHRVRVMRELLQTEESYVAGLKKLVDVCSPCECESL
jgi:Trp operon repressor